MANTITVRLFARLAELAGTRSLELDIGEGLTAGDAYNLLAQRDTALAGFAASIAYAVNQEYVDATAPLHPGDELALIPPVSGGAAGNLKVAPTTDRGSPLARRSGRGVGGEGTHAL